MDLIPFKDVMNHKMVIVVRKDVDMGKGKLAAQVAHAAVSCAIECYKTNPKLYETWYNEGQKKVVVKVESEQELIDLDIKAFNCNIIRQLVADAGRTQIEKGTITCLGIGPDASDKIDAITTNLKLL